MKKILVTGIGVLVIVAVVLVLRGIFGAEGGFGVLGNDSAESVTNTRQQTVSTQESEDSSASLPSDSSLTDVGEDDPNHITVLIDENRVYVDGDEVESAEELRQLVDLKYKDNVVFELKETNSILATHEWVMDTFEELAIPLTGVLE